jgi:hypothetical protein|tara:strand:+ start:38623 stop:39837 length:1215 start_codon:yes stop_codon:yes gene_type:complete
MSQYDHVPPYFKSVTDKEFDDNFIADRNKVIDWVGVLFTQNVFDNEVTMSHDQLTNWLGSWGMGLTGMSSYKAWTFEDYADKSKWERIVWRLFHVYPLGFLISRYKFYKLDYLGTWNPAVESFATYSKGTTTNMMTSNRHINGASIAQAMYMKIFGEITEFEDNASIALALYDVFSANPNIDNPLFVTLRRAFKKTLCVNAYPLPYFWNDFILHLFGSVPSEYKDISHLITIQDKDPKNFKLDDVLYQGDVDIEVQQPLVEENNEKSQAVIISADENMFNAIFNRLCSMLDSEEYSFNGKGAVLHKIENHYFLVHPLWVNRICDKNTDESIADQVVSYALETEKIVLYTGHIDIPNKSGFPVHLALVNPLLHKHLPDKIINADNNVDIRIIEKNSTQTIKSSQY